MHDGEGMILIAATRYVVIPMQAWIYRQEASGHGCLEFWAQPKLCKPGDVRTSVKSSMKYMAGNGGKQVGKINGNSNSVVSITWTY